MAAFVDAYGRHMRGPWPRVNLDLVAQLEPVQRSGDDSSSAYDCLSADGREIGRVDADDIPDHPPAIIPETRGSNIVCFSERGHEAFPVLAWRIVDGIGDPVTFQRLTAVWCLECVVEGASFWVFVDAGRRFETFVEAEQYAAGRVKAVRQRDATGPQLALVEATGG